MTIAYSCLCFVSISRGLMTKLVGFLRVLPLKFVGQIVWFFSFLISLLFGPFFSVYICVWFYLLQSICNTGYFSRTSFVNFLKGNYVLISSCRFWKWNYLFLKYFAQLKFFSVECRAWLDKAKMAFCKSFLNHMKWHYIYLLSSSIHLSSSIFTLHYIYLLYVGDIIERDLSLWGLLPQKFYLLDFNYRKHLL